MGGVDLTEEQIIAALRRAEGGMPAAAVYRSCGQRACGRNQYAGVDVAALRRLKQRLRDLAQRRVRYGLRGLHVLL